MDPNQVKAASYDQPAYGQPQTYGQYGGSSSTVYGVSSTGVHLVGATDPLNDPRIKYSETLCYSRAVSWFPFADMIMWLFLFNPRTIWIFALLMILSLSGVFAGKLMQRAWAYTYFGVVVFMTFLRFVALIVVLAFSDRIGRFTGAIAVGILITIVFQITEAIYVKKFINLIPTLSDDEKTLLKPLATCCCDADCTNCFCP